MAVSRCASIAEVGRRYLAGIKVPVDEQAVGEVLYALSMWNGVGPACGSEGLCAFNTLPKQNRAPQTGKSARAHHDDADVSVALVKYDRRLVRRRSCQRVPDGTATAWRGVLRIGLAPLVLRDAAN